MKVPHTWQAEVRGHYEGWKGETYIENGNTRLDFIMTPKYTNVVKTFVDITRGQLLITGSGTRLNEHVPIGMTIQYDVNAKYQPLPPRDNGTMQR